MIGGVYYFQSKAKSERVLACLMGGKGRGDGGCSLMIIL